MKRDTIIIVKALVSILLIWIMYNGSKLPSLPERHSNSNGFEIHKKNNNEWKEIQISAQHLITDQGRLIERLNHEISQRESDGNGLRDFKTRNTSSADIQAIQLARIFH
jgi:hypothetical protein